MDLGLQGKIALITGGSHGIGLAIARSLADEGCITIICSRSRDRLNEALEVLNTGGISHYGYQFDALSRSSIEGLLTELYKQHPQGVDILINNVGGGGRWGNEAVVENPLSVWDEVYQKNVGVAIQLTCALLPNMLKKCWGRVIGITSIYGRSVGGRPWFNVAKFAETALFKNLSSNRDFVRSGVTFNTVAPGGIYIPDTGWDQQRRDNPAAFKQMVDSNFPMGRLGSPEEVASVVAFLCSKRASLVNGASILVDGGECPVI
jgi:3-oxoacyl-[acyl-carrier protein] reductase